MKIALAAALTALMGSTGYAQSPMEKLGVHRLTGAAPTTADFVTEAAIGDRFEIASAKLAQQRAGTTLKHLAATMLADHTRMLGELTQAAQAAKVPLPADLDAIHTQLLQELRVAQSRIFDQQYRTDVDKEHSEAVSLFQRYADGGDNPALKAYAAKTLPTLQQHGKEAKVLDR